MPCRYLFGPVTAAFADEHLAGHRRAGRCLAFNRRGDADLTIGPGDSWADVLARLPAGWSPDLVALWLPYTAVPEGLWAAPVPLVGLAGDWNLLWHPYRPALGRCEAALTDAPGVEALRRAGLAHARPANLYGLGRPYLEEPPGDDDGRDIDVLFVGNLNPAVQRERMPWLGRLARLAGRRKVLVATGVRGAGYRALLRRAKVAFNRSVRGECNQRALEAAACGALLFQERGNREVPAVLRDRVECVGYGDDDLEGLLEHYLTHDAGRRAVTAAARAKAEACRFEDFWGETLAGVEAELGELRERARARPAVSAADALLGRAWQFVGGLDPGADPALAADLAAEAVRRPSAALHLALGLAGPPGEAAGHFRRAAACDPGHPVAGLNLAEALAAAGDKRAAEAEARRVLALLGRDVAAPPGAWDGPHFPARFDHFRVEWERAAWARAGGPADEAAAKATLLRWRLHALLADLTGDLAHRYEAVLARPDLAPTRAALGLDLARAGRPAEAAAHLRRAVEADPFDAGAARGLADALAALGRAAERDRLALDRRLLAAAAPGVVRPEPWFDATPAAPFTVVWEGAQEVNHSFAHVNRELCRRLAARGHDVRLLTPVTESGDCRMPPGGVQFAWATPAPDRPADAHVRHVWPPDWRPPPAGHWVVVQPWEYGSLPRDWVGPLAALVDEAWVPSRFVRDCYVQSGVPADRVFVVPNGVDTGLFRPGAPPYPLRTGKRFKFLFVGGTLWRKGFDLLLDAYAASFTAADDVCLVVKDLGTGSFYRGQTAGAAVGRLRATPGAPEVEYIDRDLSPEELAGLYAACDCLAHPYRGEGFALPVAEAMACGLPPVVTGAGPAVEFCDARTAYLVPARPARLPERRVGDIETVDFPWVFEPDAGALRALLRHAAGHPGEVRAKGRAAAAYARAHLSWDRAADAVEGRLRGLRGRPVRRLVAPAPPPAAPRRRARVSLVMMVRDEERNLPDCLGPAAGLFDEVVVVDTGSADGTKAVAAALGAKVFDFPWADSFSAARNEGLRHATGDWAFWLDADDRLDAPNLAGLRALFDGLGGERAAYVMKCRCVPDGPGGSATVVDHLRLFRNDPALRWDYRVHEQILPAVRRAGHEVRRAGVVIDHVGYTDPALRRRKLRRDLRLLRLEEVERPGDPFTQFNLGSVHHELGEPAEAVACLRRSLARSHPSDSIVRKLYALIAHCHRQQGRGAEALAACAEGRRHYPDDAELLFVEAQARRDAGDAAGAEVCLRRLLGGGDDPHFASVDDGLRGHKGRQNLASLLYGQGRHREAEALWREALAGKPGFAPAALGLGELYAAQGRWPDLARLAAGLGAAGAGAEAAVLAAQGHLARGEFGAAREALAGAIARHPRALLPRVALGRALLREGRDAAAAARALRDVLALDPGNAEARRGLEALGGYGAAGPTPGAG